jgi:hypothetical protein
MLHHNYPEHVFLSDHRFALPKRTLTRYNPMYFRGLLMVTGIWGAWSFGISLFGLWMESPRFDWLLRAERRKREVAEYALSMPAVMAANPISHFSQF